ncbi:hypothetical protein GGQ20_003256 [Salinibacter ruber]|nr:hypothetical protein [Salinibacter ruber]MCS3701913.1 hypothetical protein [Salinibacter ruber]
MNLSDVDSGGLGAFRFLLFFDLVLTPKLVLIAVPSNLDSFRFLTRRPVNQHRVVATPIGEAQHTVVT